MSLDKRFLNDCLRWAIDGLRYEATKKLVDEIERTERFCARYRKALVKISKDKVRIEYRGMDEAVYEDSEVAKIAKEALSEGGE